MSDSQPKKSIEKMRSELQTHSFPEFNYKNSVPDNEANFTPKHVKRGNDDGEINENEAKPWPKAQNDQGENAIDNIVLEAKQEGFEQGVKEGRSQELKKIDSLRQMISTAIADMEKFKIQLVEQSEKSILKLVLAISKKIILREPSIDSELILKIVNNALKMVIDPSYLTIKVNQDDLQTINQSKESLNPVLSKSATVKIEADAVVSTGGCVIETDFGDIDARLESQLDIVKKTLNDQFHLSAQKKAN